VPTIVPITRGLNTTTDVSPPASALRVGISRTAMPGAPGIARSRVMTRSVSNPWAHCVTPGAQPLDSSDLLGDENEAPDGGSSINRGGVKAGLGAGACREAVLSPIGCEGMYGDCCLTMAAARTARGADPCACGGTVAVEPTKTTARATLRAAI